MKLNTQDVEVIENAATLSKSQFKDLYVGQGYTDEDAGNSWHMIRVSTKGREAMSRLNGKHIDPSANETPINSKIPQTTKTKMKTTQLNVAEAEAAVSPKSERTVEQLAADVAANDIAVESGDPAPSISKVPAPKKNVKKTTTAEAPVKKETIGQIEDNIAQYAGKGAKNKKKEEVIPTPAVKVDKKKEKAEPIVEKVEPKKATKKKEAIADGDRGDKTAKAKEMILAGTTNAKEIAEGSGAAVAYVRTLLYNMRKKGEIGKVN